MLARQQESLIKVSMPDLDFTDWQEGLVESVSRPSSLGSNEVLLDLSQLLGKLIYGEHAQLALDCCLGHHGKLHASNDAQPAHAGLNGHRGLSTRKDVYKSCITATYAVPS